MTPYMTSSPPLPTFAGFWVPRALEAVPSAQLLNTFILAR